VGLVFPVPRVVESTVLRIKNAVQNNAIKTNNILAAAFVTLLLSCSSSCSGLDDLAHRQQKKDYTEMFAGDPAAYARSYINKGDYKYWGFREGEGEAETEWIPGIAGRSRDLNRFDFTSIGSQINNETQGATESLFKKYNAILKEKRREAVKRGVKFDVYWNVIEGR
jgi:hypothetical protein